MLPFVSLPFLRENKTDLRLGGAAENGEFDPQPVTSTAIHHHTYVGSSDEWQMTEVGTRFWESETKLPSSQLAHRPHHNLRHFSGSG